ncbi:MAG TPA: hypothetical protein VEY08_17305 [Chloroflexia bacterium]|nr:hypothetical protein [Chloroflexia bacterium]
MWLATRIVFIIFTYVAVIFNTQGFDPADMGLGGSFPPDVVLNHWKRWDTDWYLHIASVGYQQDPLRTAFFPLYPLLIHVFSSAGDLTFQLSIALLISNLGALAAFIALGLLAAHEAGPEASPFAITSLAAYPFAFFLAAAYPDSLFLGLAIFSIFFARRGLWYGAATCAFIAALTRPTGIILVLPLLWEFAHQHGWLTRRWREKMRLDILAKCILVAGAVPAAVGLYALYLWDLFGNPLVFLSVQAFWRHTFVPPWDLPGIAMYAILKEPAWSFNQLRVLVDVVPVIVFVALTIALARRMPITYTFYMVGALYVTLASPLVTYFDPFASVPRYLLVAFPAFLLVGQWMMRHQWLNIAVTSGGFMLQAIFAGFFLMGGWMV